MKGLLMLLVARCALALDPAPVHAQACPEKLFGSPKEFAAQVRADIARNAVAVKATGVRID